MAAVVLKREYSKWLTKMLKNLIFQGKLSIYTNIRGVILLPFEKLCLESDGKVPMDSFSREKVKIEFY